MMCRRKNELISVAGWVAAEVLADGFHLLGCVRLEMVAVALVYGILLLFHFGS